MSMKVAVMAAFLFALTGWVPNASAQDTDEPPEALKELWAMSPDAREEALKGMSEKERDALRTSARAYREQQRARRAAMTPEERNAARQKARERFEALPPEEQEAMKERRKQRQKSGNRSSTDGQGQRGKRGSGNESP